MQIIEIIADISERFVRLNIIIGFEPIQNRFIDDLASGHACVGRSKRKRLYQIISNTHGYVP